MSKYISVLLFAGICLCKAQPSENEIAVYQPFLVQYEGYCQKVYLDNWGTKSVGIGHNLSAHRQESWRKVYNHAQIQLFFIQDLTDALKSARSYVINFDGKPEEIKQVIIGIIWTVGDNGFSKFYKLRLALANANYKLASIELKNSLWSTQVSENRVNDFCYILNLAK